MVKEEEPEKKPIKEEFEIVTELPQQPIRKFVDESGKETTLYTISEALKEILTIVRKLDRAF